MNIRVISEWEARELGYLHTHIPCSHRLKADFGGALVLWHFQLSVHRWIRTPETPSSKETEMLLLEDNGTLQC